MLNRCQHTKSRSCISVSLLLIIICTLATSSVLAEPSMQVFALKNRPAAEIQPLVAPFLDASDRVLANGSNLIIRSTPERLVEIEQLIHQLDKPLNNLLISVAQGRNINAQEMNAQASVSVAIPINQPSASGAIINGQLNQSEIHKADNITQQVRTLDGQAAHIQTGNIHPVQNRQRYSGYPATTEYIDTTTGFVVTPRLNGNQVTIEVSPWSDRMQRNGAIETRSAQTTFTANLGEWVEIGGNIESSQNSQYGILSRSRNNSHDEMQILIKVDKAK